MIETLAEKTCTPCRGGVPPLPHDEAQRLQVQAPNWELADDAHRIERTLRFWRSSVLGIIASAGNSSGSASRRETQRWSVCCSPRSTIPSGRRELQTRATLCSHV